MQNLNNNNRRKIERKSKSNNATDFNEGLRCFG